MTARSTVRWPRWSSPTWRSSSASACWPDRGFRYYRHWARPWRSAAALALVLACIWAQAPEAGPAIRPRPSPPTASRRPLMIRRGGPLPERSRRATLATVGAAAARLALPGLGGCSAFLKRPTTIPMPTVTDLLPLPPQGRTLVVLIPGAYSTAEDFVTHGFVTEVRATRLTLDMVAVDAHRGYFDEGSLLDRLRADVIRPARARLRADLAGRHLARRARRDALRIGAARRTLCARAGRDACRRTRCTAGPDRRHRRDRALRRHAPGARRSGAARADSRHGIGPRPTRVIGSAGCCGG